MRRLIVGILLLSSFCSVAQRLLSIKQNNLWGCIDLDAKIVIEPKYDFISDFGKDGFAIARLNGVLTLVDTTGWELATNNTEELILLGGKLFKVRKGGKWGVIDINQKEVIRVEHDEIKQYSKTIFASRSDKKWGLINTYNDTISEFRYDYVLKNVQGLIEAYFDTYKHVFNSKGVFLFSTENEQVKHLSDKYYLIQGEKGIGIKDTVGEFVVLPEYDKSKYENYGFVELSNQKSSILFSAFHGEVISYNLTGFVLVHANRFQFRDFRGAGIIDNLGKVLVPNDFRSFQFVDDLIISSYTDGSFTIYDQNGNRLIPGSMKSFDLNTNLKLINYKSSKGWNLRNFDGELLLDINQDTIVYEGNIIKAYKGTHYTRLTMKNGEISDVQKFENFTRIKLKRADDNDDDWLNASEITPIPSPQNNEIANRGQWFFDSRLRLWGLQNAAGKVIAEPKFNSILYSDTLPFTVVYKSNWIPNDFQFQSDRVSLGATVGIYDHLNKNEVINVEHFSSLRYQDFIKGSKVARCVENLENSKISIIDVEGNLYDIEMNFMDSFQENKARIFIEGDVAKCRNDRFAYVDVDAYFSDLRGQRTRLFDGLKYKSINGKWNFLDFDGNYVLANDYSFAQNYKHDRAIVAKKDKWGVIDTSENTIIDFDFDYIQRLNDSKDSLFITTNDNSKWGVLTENGVVLIPAKYDDIEPTLNHQFYIIKEGEERGVLNSEFGLLFKKKCDRIELVHDSTFLITNSEDVWLYDLNNRIDLKGTDGRVLNGFAVTTSMGTDFVYNYKGEFINQCGYSIKNITSNGNIIYEANGKSGFKKVDKKKTKAPKYDFLKLIDDNVLVYRKGEEEGVMNESGKKLSSFENERIEDIGDGFLRVTKNEKVGLSDVNGKELIPPKYDFVDRYFDGFALVRLNGKYNYLNRDQKLLSNIWFEKAKSFMGGYAFVQNDKLSYIIDYSGGLKKVKYDDVSVLKSGLILAESGTGSVILTSNLDTISLWSNFISMELDENSAIISSGSKKTLVNTYGASTCASSYDDLIYIGNGKYKFLITEYYQVFDIDGRSIISQPSEEVKLVTNSLFKVSINNTIGYLRKDGSWFWKMTY